MIFLVDANCGVMHLGDIFRFCSAVGVFAARINDVY